ncbi:hypothetical protein ACI6Q2_13530 [Chitinophagaceae bacterium LWZ2-11]
MKTLEEFTAIDDKNEVPRIINNERGPNYKAQDIKLPKAILCDLDGTLAILQRKPFESLKCESDLVNEPIADIIRMYYSQDVRIILMSGREEISEKKTRNWLAANNIPFHDLFMRKTKDNRKDAIIKKELFEANVKDKYFVQFVLDDRNQVVDLWRLELGLPCLQVNYGDF